MTTEQVIASNFNAYSYFRVTELQLIFVLAIVEKSNKPLWYQDEMAPG